MLVVVTSLASLSDKYLNVNLQFRMRTFFQFNFIHFVNHRRWEENLFIMRDTCQMMSANTMDIEWFT